MFIILIYVGLCISYMTAEIYVCQPNSLTWLILFLLTWGWEHPKGLLGCYWEGAISPSHRSISDLSRHIFPGIESRGAFTEKLCCMGRSSMYVIRWMLLFIYKLFFLKGKHFRTSVSSILHQYSPHRLLISYAWNSPIPIKPSHAKRARGNIQTLLSELCLEN